MKHLHTHVHEEDYCLHKYLNVNLVFHLEQSTKQDCSYVNPRSDVHKGRFYETCRGEQDSYTNAYNPIVLKHLQSNMDIQIVSTPESATYYYYVCAYLCKSEPEELKFALSKLIYDISQSAPINTRTKLLRIGCCVLKTRRLSTQEACFRLSDLQLVYNSRTVIAVNCRPCHKRYRIFRPQKDRHNLPENISPNDMFKLNSYEYYVNRPISLNHITFHKFLSWYAK